jgi:hypothetical protein
MEIIPCGFGASTTAQRLHSAPSSHPGFRLRMFQIWADKYGYTSMMTVPYPHPQHVKVGKHLVYVWGGYGNHSMWVWSLNHCTKASFSTKQSPGILADVPNLGQQVWLYQHDDGSISTSTAYEVCQTSCICLGWIWILFHVGFGASITDLRLHLVPSSDPGFCLTFQIWANKYGYISMMMDPYPHPQHMKVAKHLVHIWTRCGNHSTWVWSLNHCTKASFSTKQ